MTFEDPFPGLIAEIWRCARRVEAVQNSEALDRAHNDLNLAWENFYQELFKFGEKFATKNSSLNEALEK